MLVETGQTDVLASTGQLHCCELLLIVFLERWSKLLYDLRSLDGKGLDICKI
jgi:hypothetical protein